MLKHRLLSFARRKPRDRWIFEHVDGIQRETLFFDPYLSMNDYAGLVPAILAGSGVGELPPVVLPDLSRKDLLVEVMPKRRLRTFDLSLLHLSNRNLSQAVRAFQEFSAKRTQGLFTIFPVEFKFRETCLPSVDDCGWRVDLPGVMEVMLGLALITLIG